MIISFLSLSFTADNSLDSEYHLSSDSEPLKRDSIEIDTVGIDKSCIYADMALHFYDTAGVFEKNWLVNQTFAYTNEEETFSDSTVIEICNVFRDFAYPVKNSLNSEFGYRRSGFHKGLDIKLSRGDTVVAAFDGKVRYSKYNTGGFGNLVIIRHHNGLETYYAHLTDLLIQPNEYVKAGEVIGTGGNTGVRRSGPHLHFEVRIEDKPLNPESIFDFESFTLQDQVLVLTDNIFSPRGLNSKSNHTHGSEGTKARVYYVRSGDNLYAIARRNKTSVNTLCKVNRLTENSILQIGQKIMLY